MIYFDAWIVPGLFNRSPSGYILCPLTCPIIHRVYHYFLAKCSVLELLIMSLPHFRGFFRGPLEWRMTFSFQDLDVWRVYCYWVVTATVSLADKAGDTCCVCNLCMHLQLFLDLPFVSRLSWTSSFCSRQLSFITTWIPLTSCSCLSITSRADSDCPGSLHPPPTVTDITVRCQRSVMVVLA